MLGSSAFAIEMANADEAAAATNSAAQAGYGFGTTSNGSSGCYDDGKDGTGRAACDLCVPFTEAFGSANAAKGGQWVSSKYLSVLYAYSETVPLTKVTSYEDVCTQFWDRTGTVTTLGGTRFQNPSAVGSVGNLLAYVRNS